MKRALVAAVTFAVGCASAGFHEGRTALRKNEQRYLIARAGAAKTAFARFWAMPGRPSIVGGGSCGGRKAGPVPTLPPACCKRCGMSWAGSTNAPVPARISG